MGVILYQVGNLWELYCIRFGTCGGVILYQVGDLWGVILHTVGNFEELKHNQF